MIKICEKCFREYYEENGRSSPAEELGQIFFDTIQNQDTVNLCPNCREDLGFLNLLGFGA